MTTINNDDFIFADEDTGPNTPSLHAGWKILIVDDEKDIHSVTMLTFANFTFEDKPIIFLNAYSAAQAKEIVQQHKDIAVILLDVVMEEDDSGLKFIRYFREELGNALTRIILRTGQPGYAPERSVIVNYDINDYKEKTELTANKFFTAVVMGLRSYRDMSSLEEHKRRLQESSEAAARFVPKNFLKLLNKESISHVKLGDRVKQQMTVLFLDIRAFTSLSENLTPEENFEFLNSCLSYLEPAIVNHNGFIDKYIGDSIMALFADHADAALAAGIEMQRSLVRFNIETSRSEELTVRAGVGINTGNIMMGAIGFHDRMECTAISDVVNTAARIEKLTKIYGASLLISELTLIDIEHHDNFNIRLIANAPIIGKKAPIKIYEVFDIDPENVIAAKRQTKAAFEQAVNDFNNDLFSKAQQAFSEILAINALDKGAQVYFDKCNIELNSHH